MNRSNGFSFIELLTSIAILSLVMGAAIGALVQAQKATTAVGLMANTQQNLRIGMNFMMRDLTQAGEGMPPGGCFHPSQYSGQFESKPARHTPCDHISHLLYGFTHDTPGYANRPACENSQRDDRSGVLDGNLQDGHHQPGVCRQHTGGFERQQAISECRHRQRRRRAPVCSGSIAASGSSATLDANCFTMPGGPTPISAGNLILFTNGNGTALEVCDQCRGTDDQLRGRRSGRVERIERRDLSERNGRGHLRVHDGHVDYARVDDDLLHRLDNQSIEAAVGAAGELPEVPGGGAGESRRNRSRTASRISASATTSRLDRAGRVLCAWGGRRSNSPRRRQSRRRYGRST